MSGEDHDVEVRSHGDAWPIVPNPSTYDVLRGGRKVGEVTAWDQRQALEKARRGEFRRTR